MLVPTNVEVAVDFPTHDVLLLILLFGSVSTWLSVSMGQKPIAVICK